MGGGLAALTVSAGLNTRTGADATTRSVPARRANGSSLATRLAATFAVLVLALALAAPAFAQTSSQDGYTDQAGQVQGQFGGTGSGGGGSLPFTGLDVALFAGAGALLAAAGIGLRRLTRAPHGNPA